MLQILILLPRILQTKLYNSTELNFFSLSYRIRVSSTKPEFGNGSERNPRGAGPKIGEIVAPESGSRPLGDSQALGKLTWGSPGAYVDIRGEVAKLI